MRRGPIWITEEGRDGWQTVVRIRDWHGRPPAPHIEGRIKRPVQHMLEQVEGLPDDAAVWFYVGQASDSDEGHLRLGELRQIAGRNTD